MKKKEEKIPFSNYVTLALIVVATIAGVLILRNIYINNINYEKKIPVIRDMVVSEINSNEVYNYIRENGNALIYIGVADDDNCRKLEEELEKVIKQNNLEDTITYLNLSSEKKRQTFIKDFNKFYSTKILGIPSFVVFKDGKVSDILTVKNSRELTIKEVTNFLEENNIMEGFYD